MAHITDSELQKAGRRSSYTLGLRMLMRERPIYQSLDVDLEVLDARYGGTLTIPEQYGTRVNDKNEIDNTKVGYLDPITWVEEMMGGANTSEFDLFEPTIQIDETNYFTKDATVNETIENNFLKVTVTLTGTPTVARGHYVKLGDTIPRLYKVHSAVDKTWLLVPGRLPWSTFTRIQVADSLRFRLVNPSDIVQYRDWNRRGPFRMEYIEAR